MTETLILGRGDMIKEIIRGDATSYGSLHMPCLIPLAALIM